MQMMRPAIRFKREDCVDLPPVSFETRRVELMPAQAKAYKQMLNTLKMESKNGNILASNEAIKTGKLLQIACGTVYDNKGEGVVLPAENRIAVVKEIIEQAAAKVLVFVPFKLAAEKVHEELSKIGKYALIHGGVSKTKRDAIFREFQNPGSDLDGIVAQPGTMSHGLTLVEADTIIWFAPIHSNETFQQAIARISRPGQQRPQLIVMIEGTEIERRIYHRLQHRERLQGVLLDMIKGDTDQ
jgi:SNF2 family DNA or RNA helicase